MCFAFDARPPELPADLALPPIAGGTSAEVLELSSADGTRFSAALAESPEARDPGVLIFPDVRGLYPFYMELAERFAHAGHHAIAFDYFGRTAGAGASRRGLRLQAPRRADQGRSGPGRRPPLPSRRCVTAPGQRPSRALAFAWAGCTDSSPRSRSSTHASPRPASSTRSTSTRAHRTRASTGAPATTRRQARMHGGGPSASSRAAHRAEQRSPARVFSLGHSGSEG